MTKERKRERARRLLGQQILADAKAQRVSDHSWQIMTTRIKGYMESSNQVARLPEVAIVAPGPAPEMRPLGVGSDHIERWRRFFIRTQRAKTKEQRLRILKAMARYVHGGFLGVFDA